MPIDVICPGCNAHFRAPEKLAGAKRQCPKCKTSLTVPTPTVPTPPPIVEASPPRLVVTTPQSLYQAE